MYSDSYIVLLSVLTFFMVIFLVRGLFFFIRHLIFFFANMKLSKSEYLYHYCKGGYHVKSFFNGMISGIIGAIICLLQGDGFFLGLSISWAAIFFVGWLFFRRILENSKRERRRLNLLFRRNI